MGVYRVPGWFRLLLLVTFALCAVLGAYFVFAVATGHEDASLVFTIGWLLSLGWNGYWWLHRVALAVAMTPTALRWRTVTTSGEVPLSAVVRARPSRLGSHLEVIEHRHGAFLVLAGRGLPRFLRALARARPGIDVQAGWMARRVGGALHAADTWWHP